MNAALKEKRYAELLQQRCMTEALIANAKKMAQHTWLIPQERLWWQDRLADLQAQHNVDNACMRAVLSQDDKDRFADERESARREDAECVGASNGATEWESL